VPGPDSQALFSALTMAPAFPLIWGLFIGREDRPVTNLWHDHCTVKINWDFSAQLEDTAMPGSVFRARQRLFQEAYFRSTHAIEHD
jgi:hypothetical protein